MTDPKDLKINETKIQANRLPFRCVVCQGFGTVAYGRKTCGACGGKGYIVIDQEVKP